MPNPIDYVTHGTRAIVPWHFLRIYINEAEKFRGFIITPSAGSDIGPSDRTVPEGTAVTFRVELRESRGSGTDLPTRAGSVNVGYKLSGDALVANSTVTVGTQTDSPHTGTLTFPVGTEYVNVVVTPGAVTGSGGANRTLTMELINEDDEGNTLFSAMDDDKVRLDTRSTIQAGVDYPPQGTRNYTRRETLITITVTDS